MLDRQTKMEMKNLAPIEVGGSICLSSNRTSPTLTSLGGNTEISVKDLNFSDKNNLTNLFSLLLKIDRRNNPNLYKQSYESNNFSS